MFFFAVGGEVAGSAGDGNGEAGEDGTGGGGFGPRFVIDPDGCFCSCSCEYSLAIFGFGFDGGPPKRKLDASFAPTLFPPMKNE